MKQECLFCSIVERKIFENEYFFALFDAHPVSPGHALVIPKEHIVSLFDLSTEQRAAMQEAIKETVKIIEATDFRALYEGMIELAITTNSAKYCQKMLALDDLDRQPDGYNIGNNEGRAAGRTIDHLHIQIIPRYERDVNDHVGGIRNVIEGLGNYTKE